MRVRVEKLPEYAGVAGAFSHGTANAHRSAGGGQALHKILFAFEEGAELRAGGVGFDAALDFGEFVFGSAVFQGFDAAFGFFPGEFVRIFKQDFEEDAAVAVVEFGADLGGLDRFAGQHGSYECGQNFLGFEADVEFGFVDLVGEFEAETFGFGEHADNSALGGFCRPADEFGFDLHFAAAFGGGFGQLRAQNGFVETELLRDACRPFGA